MSRMKRIVAAFCTALLAGPAFAQAAAADKAAPSPVDIRLIRNKVVLLDGKETRQDASFAKPGDVLEEVVTYSNTSRGSLGKFEATLPVPANTELVMSSIKPANAKASTDGVTFEPVPLKRRVRQPNGVETEVQVPLSEYRYLRWYPGELAAGKPLTYSARFRIAGENAAATATTRN